MNDYEIRYRVNHRLFMQYYRQNQKDLVTGRKKSERRMAAEIGVSHTQLQDLRKGKDTRGKAKTHVNLATARLIEHGWHIPEDVAFVPDLVDGMSTKVA